MSNPKSFYTLAIVTLLFILCAEARPQVGDTTVVRVIRAGKPIGLRDALTDRKGRRVLLLDTNEVVELSVESGVEIETSSDNSVRVLDNKYLVGLAPGTDTIIRFRNSSGDELGVDGIADLIVAVEDVDAGRPIVAESTFLSYKVVKDNFGKKFAQTFFVVQVDIRNEKLDKQFIVQNVSVIIDPNQCIGAREIYSNFDQDDCLTIFDTHFVYPTAQFGTRSEEVLGTGKADLNRSNRNVGFRILEFSAAMGTVLSGFNGVLGPDGVKGMNVLGTTVSAAANRLFPNTADDKFESLRKAQLSEDMIIKSKESRTINIFIPADRIFYDESWKMYIQPARSAKVDSYKFKVALDMLLLSTATGVLVDNDAPKVEVRSGDEVANQVTKFGIKNLLRLAYTQSTRVRELRRQLFREATSADVAVKSAAKPKLIRALSLMQQAAAADNAKLELSPPIAFVATEGPEALARKLEAAIRSAVSNAESEADLTQVTAEILRILEEAVKE